MKITAARAYLAILLSFSLMQSPASAQTYDFINLDVIPVKNLSGLSESGTGLAEGENREFLMRALESEIPISIFQDFEPNNGSEGYGSQVNFSSVSVTSEQVRSGAQAFKIASASQYGGAQIQSQTQHWDMDFHPDKNDRLTFWIWADPSNGEPNDVGVRFFDTSNYTSSMGFEVYTTKKAAVGEWTQLEVLFSQLPPDFDLSHVYKLQFVNYWPGTYYLDDIELTLKDRIYQSFEKCENINDCAWAWDGTVGIEQDAGLTYEGNSSLRFTALQNWAGTGMRSQERKYDPAESDNQSYWHVDLNPAHNDRLTFWVYNIAENGMANNVGVQFFDHGQYFTNPAVVWTKDRAEYRRWTKLSVLFNELPADLDLTDINKIQFQVFWKDSYLFDDVRAAQQSVKIDRMVLDDGIVQWNALAGNYIYEVQEALSGPLGTWSTVYEGNNTQFIYNRLSSSWLRIRYKQPTTSLAPNRYVSDWSAPVEYLPKLVILNSSELKNNNIQWYPIAQTALYQLQTSSERNGPWSDIYEGPAVLLTAQAIAGEYYRVRGVKKSGNTITDATTWSPAIKYDPQNFVKASGLELRDQSGIGEVVQLRGVNMGNLLLIEPEFTGIGGDFTLTETDDDDFSIRNALTQRFGSDELLDTFQQNYITPADFDHFSRLGINLIRLPIYYKALLDNLGGVTQFEIIDNLLKAAADRGIYVLLDLHGAPGGQSSEIHSGEAGLNQLFEDSPEGAAHRLKMVEVWEALAQRYKNNTTIAGYDILNEPFGARDHDSTLQAPHGLWALYARLYTAIRAIDPEHLIVFESIPSDLDWDTLPNPSLYGWQNVLYQFHYYGFKFDEQGNISGTMDFDEHKDYIDTKIANARQNEFNVPVLVGEFNGFNLKNVWEYYLSNFKDQNWNWALWTYKTHPNLADWGLFVHTEFNGPVDVTVDDETVITDKFLKYKTSGNFTPNMSLIDTVSPYMEKYPVILPVDDKIIHENEALNFNIFASQVDGLPLTLFAELDNANSLSSIGATFIDLGTGTGIFNWTPQAGQAGTYTIIFKAADSQNHISYEKVTITVEEGNHNAQITSPVLGSVINNSTVTFKWSTGANVTNYYFGVGTNFSSVANAPWGNIFAGAVTGNSKVINGIPLNGQPVYVRMWSKIAGTWFFEDYSFPTVSATAQITSPTPGSAIDQSSVTFQWNSGAGVTDYFLGVGTSYSSVIISPWGNIFAGAVTGNSKVINGIPLNGQPFYVRMWSKIGGKWFSNDYTFSTISPGAQITSPTPGSTIDQPSMTFTWNSGTGVTDYFFGVGTTAASVATWPWGNIFAGAVTGNSKVINGIPLNGQPVYARLWSKVNGVWSFKDYSYNTTIGIAEITFPAAGSTITESPVTFQWSPGANVTAYYIGVGSTQGAISNTPWGNFFAEGVNGTSKTVTTIPLNGNPVYVRLWSKISGVWYFKDYVFNTSN